MGPLSPTMFNLVMDVVVKLWVYLVAEGEEGSEGWGREVHIRASFFTRKMA